MLKTAKGTQDFDTPTQTQRQKLIDICVEQFKLVGAKPIDTPTFEREDVLMEKYGEESTKEIFRLSNNNENNENNSENNNDTETLALRYDLTVPFSRYVKMNNIKKLKKYQVGKVYRKDQPNMKSGRFREFLQADFDHLNSECDSELADAETLVLLNNILLKLTSKIINGEYVIRLNNKQLLFNMLEFCGVQPDLYKTVCSSIDKLDKREWKDIEPELLSKGLTQDCIDRMNNILTKYKNIDWDTLKYLPFKSDVFDKLYHYLLIFGGINTIKLDLSLARGIDYYTGIIFEVNLINTNIGSVAGGGRYDELCNIPCVGFSIGIDRILSILPTTTCREYNPTVWIIQVNKKSSNETGNNELFEYRLKILKELRDNGISCNTELKTEVSMGAQIKYVLKNEIPFIIFVGQNEMEQRLVSLKDMDNKTQYDNIPMIEAMWRINNNNTNMNK